jgi:2'-5' RNA ligase
VRLFVAFELPPPLQTRIVDRLAPLHGELPAASWVPAERLHLTLVFLGEVDAAKLEALGTTLRPVFAASPRMRLRLAGAGTFPPDRPARVAWVGVEGRAVSSDVRDPLAAIERRTRIALAPLLDRPLEDRPYHAHVTVARPRSPWNRRAVATFREACDEVAGEWDAERAVLMESRPGSQATYSVRHGYTLGGEAAA